MPFVEVDGKRVLFIHIPKTGGTTVEGWLKMFGPLNLYTLGIPPASHCAPQHYRMHDIRHLFVDGYFDYSFTIVRNPYDRLESEYRMHAAIQAQGFWRMYPSFSLWLEQNLKRQTEWTYHLDNHLRPQWQFVGTHTQVFRYEDGLENALAAVASRMGVAPPQQLPRELSTKDSKIAVNWDLSDRLMVQNHYERDFEQFGYPK